jgi:hypothetical protein
MKLLLAIICLSTLITPVAAGDLLTPGSPFNPIIITPTGPGQAQATSQFPDLSRPLLAPGQPFNPIIIQRQGGQTTIQSLYPPGLEDSITTDE